MVLSNDETVFMSRIKRSRKVTIDSKTDVESTKLDSWGSSSHLKQIEILVLGRANS